MSAPRPSCRRIRPGRLAGLVLALVVAVPALAAGQPRERTMYVSALDRNGQPVESLATRDVIVREDGVAREVLRVTKATDPMQIAVLIDNSAATSAMTNDMRQGLKAFVATMAEGNEISVVTYADRPTLLVNFSTSAADLQSAVERLFPQPNSGAYMLDAILEVTQGFIKRRASRPVIVVVGTEGVEFSNAAYELVLDRLRESGAQLHVLHVVDSRPDATEEERYRSIVVDRGTRETGGRRENLLASMSLPAALGTLASELKSQFKVVFSRPESLIQPRETTVTSARPDVELRGVLVPAPAP